MCNSCLAYYYAQMILGLKRSPAFINGFLIDYYGPLQAEQIMLHLNSRISNAKPFEIENRTLKPKPRCKCEQE